MRNTKEALANVISSICGNAGASALFESCKSLATQTAAISAPVTAGSAMMGLITGPVGAAAMLTIFAGSSIWSAWKSGKVSDQQRRDLNKLVGLLDDLKDKQDFANSMLLDLAVERAWLKSAVEHAGGDDSSIVEVEAVIKRELSRFHQEGFKDLGVRVEDIQETLGGLAKLGFMSHELGRQTLAGVNTLKTQQSVDSKKLDKLLEILGAQSQRQTLPSPDEPPSTSPKPEYTQEQLALAKEAQSSEDRLTRAAGLIVGGKPQEALDELAELLPTAQVIEDKFAKWNRLQGDAHMALKQYSQAEGFYRKVLALQAPARDLAALNGLAMALAVSVEHGRSTANSTRLKESITVWTELAESAVDPIDRVTALMNRGVAYRRSGDPTNAIADYTSVIDALPKTTVEQASLVLYNRGVAYHQVGHFIKAIADFTRVITDFPDASAERIAKARFNRGATYGCLDYTSQAIADYTHVIEELSGAPVDLIAKALFNRGVSYGKSGDTPQEIADYTRVIEELPGAPIELIAKAIFNRGVRYYKSGNTPKAVADTRQAYKFSCQHQVTDIFQAARRLLEKVDPAWLWQNPCPPINPQ